MSTTAPPRRPSASSRPPLTVREARLRTARFRRALLLLAGSLVAPGSAQVAAGRPGRHRRIGVWALRVWAVIVVGGLLVWRFVPLETLVGLAVRPWLLGAFRVAVFAVAAAWVLLILDAWRLSDPPSMFRKHRLIVLGLILALVAVIVLPATTAARYATAARDALVALFPSGEAAATGGGRLNVLLLGADAGTGREGLRPDSIHLVSVDAQDGRPVMFSLPRNLQHARFPEGTPAADRFPDGFAGEGELDDYLLNATWTYGEAHPELFPGASGPGATAVKQAVEGTLGIPVHYFVVVDLRGFSDLVDALGGVTLTVTEALPIGNAGRILEAGTRRLDGYETLWYARSRASTSDYDRMARQRCVVGAILREADPGTVLRNFTGLAAASTAMLRTDIPQGQVAALLDLAVEAKRQRLAAVQFVPPTVNPADPDIAAMQERVQQALEGTPKPAVSARPSPAAAGTAAPAAPTAPSDPARHCG